MWFHLCWTVLPSSEPAFRRHKNWQMSLSFPKDTQSMYASEMENIEFTIVLWGWGTVQAKFRMVALCFSFRYPRMPGQMDPSISLCPSCTPQKFCYRNIAIPVRVLFLNYTMAPGHKSTSCALGCLHQNILQSDPVRHDHIRMGSKFQSDKKPRKWNTCLNLNPSQLKSAKQGYEFLVHSTEVPALKQKQIEKQSLPWLPLKHKLLIPWIAIVDF